MTNLDKELVKDDLGFICDYIADVLHKYPEILKDDPNLVKKFDRRINDILRRIGA